MTWKLEGEWHMGNKPDVGKRTTYLHDGEVKNTEFTSRTTSTESSSYGTKTIANAFYGDKEPIKLPKAFIEGCSALEPPQPVKEVPKT